MKYADGLRTVYIEKYAEGLRTVYIEKYAEGLRTVYIEKYVKAYVLFILRSMLNDVDNVLSTSL